MRPAAATQLLCQFSALRSIASFSKHETAGLSLELVDFGRSVARRDFGALVKGNIFFAGISQFEQKISQQVKAAAQTGPYPSSARIVGRGAAERTAQIMDRRIMETVPRRHPNVEGTRRLSAYRRDNSMQRRAEAEEEAANIDLDPAKMLEKGSTGTFQAIIKDVIPVGYFLTMPDGREAYLPATDLGFTGGVVILERLYKVGQELTVRITKVTPKRDIVSIKKEGMTPPIANQRFGMMPPGSKV